MILKTVRDVAIPAIGLGTWQMDDQVAANAVETALNMGYRHIDTAQIYRNETGVGKGISAADIAREDLFLTTKVWRDRLDADSVRTSTERSLEKLDTDYVDLLLIHWPNRDIPLDETLHTMRALKEEHLVRHIGVSNFTPDLLDQALSIAPDILINQVEMHPYFQQQDMREYCVEHDMFLTAYSPLARGRVTSDEVLQDIARQHDATAAQITLAWLVQQDNVLAIPKAVPEELQRENLNALDIQLSAAELERIEAIKPSEKLVDPGFAPW